MSDSSIAFIGGGNMAASIIGGLVANATPGQSIIVSEPDAGRLQALESSFGVRRASDNAQAVNEAATVVLAVKPQTMRDVVTGLAAEIAAREPLLVSIAAGVTVDSIRKWAGCDAPIVRTMPNTPALVRAGATALYASPRVSPTQRDRAEAVLAAVGITLWVEEEGLLDAVTAVSGSGPAYYFLLMELMEEAGTRLGLDRDSARRLTQQTALGAARIAIEGDEPPATLRERVTSPGGTTAAALAAFREGGIESLVERALTAARDRSVELGRPADDEG